MTATPNPFDLVAGGDLPALDRYLTEDPTRAADRHEESGTSLLLWALYHRQAEMAERIARDLPSLDLHEAAAMGRTERVREIAAEAPDSVSSRSDDGFTPLHLASFFGRPDTVDALLEVGAPVDAVAANPTLVTPLHSGVAGRNAQVVDRLLAAGAPVDARQQGGFTALMGAAANGLEDLLERLLEAGADPAIEDDQGRTAADLAREKGHEELAEKLG